MDHVISGVAKFQRDVYPEKKETFKKLGIRSKPGSVVYYMCRFPY